ncbi:MAG: hypothetical protein GY760_23520 [Deltaproteobacteria bacterium]|nr:hypothetical protein [Deltaproteobacteria bacterium]
MKNYFLILIITISLSSCISFSKPGKTLDFASVETVYEIDGLYKNKGIPRGFHLSELLWRWTLNTAPIHDEIELIEIVSDDEKLIVKAIKNSSVLYQKEYLEGQDFKIKNGKIHLYAFKMKRRPDDKTVGPSFQRELLGLDIKGNIKYESQMFGLVLVKSLIPVFAADFSEERFEKISEGNL